MEWYNQPKQWKIDGDTVTITTNPQTDFWQKTHDGGVRDNGHFLYQSIAGDFTAEVTFEGNYTAQYDQAGLMLRLDEANWLKCGIEYVDGVQYVSAVVTRDYSDWSVAPWLSESRRVKLRLTCRGKTAEVQYSLDGTNFRLLRQAYLPIAYPVKVGLMCASPLGDGFTVLFDKFSVGSCSEQVLIM